MAKGGGGRGVVLGFLKYVLGFDGLAFEEGLGDAEKRMKAAQKNLSAQAGKLTSLGAALTAGVTAPVVALATAAVNGYKDQVAAMAQVDAAIVSMGNKAGLTSKQLSDFADQLELKSLINADEILKRSTANLLTFGNIAGATFLKAQQAAVDMATRMGTDVQSATMLIGKALNDPIKGLTALTRVGIQFTEQQKAQIKAMTEAGNIAGAQAVILSELNRQFGGAAEAAAKADPMREVMVKLGQAGDAIGEKLLPILPQITGALVGVLDAFAGLSPETQKWVVILIAAGAALGPLLVGLGGLITAFGAFLPLLLKLGPAILVIRTGLVALTPLLWGTVKALAAMALTPVGAVITGIALAVAGVYLAWKNWDKIKPIIDRALAWIAGLYEGVKTWILDKLGKVWDAVVNKVKFVSNAFFLLYDAVVGHSYIPDMVDEIGQHIARLQGNMVKPIEAMTAKAADAFKQLQTDIGGILARVFPTEDAIRSVEAELTKLDEALAAKLISPAVWAKARERLQNELLGLRQKATEEGAAGLGIWSSEEAQRELESWGATVTDIWPKVENANDNFATSWESMAQRVMGSIEGLVGAIRGGGFFDIINSVIDVFGALGSSGALGKSIQKQMEGVQFGGFRAAGGPVAAGRSYIVGERGPEWFTPGRSGYVTPNGGERRANDNGGVVRILLDDGMLQAKIVSGAVEVVSAAAPTLRDAAVAQMETRLTRRTM